VPGCFARTVDATRECLQAGLPFQINTLVSEETLDDLPAIHRIVAAVGALRWSLFFLVNVGRGSVLRPISAVACERLFEQLVARAPTTRPIISTTEAPHFRRVVMQQARSHHDDAPRSVGHAAGIRDGNGIMFISHTGEVHPSGFLPVSAGNVRDDHPVAVYRDSDLFRVLRRADSFHGRCGRCEYRRTCGGSRARAWASTGDLLAEDPLCPYEPRSAS
jgi:radical SAM protein with 4Fe4S-binding SPASM domain